MPDAPPAPNPLRDLHASAEAEFQAYGPIEIVSTFGEPQAEYAAIRKGAALIDSPHRAAIELTGPDRLTFLNNLLTNQTFDKQTKTPLAAGSGVYAFLLSAKTGKLICDTNVLELGDRTLLEMDGRLVTDVLASMDRYRFAEKVTFRSLAGALHEIAVHGPNAIDVLTQGLDSLPTLQQPLACGTARALGHDAVAFRDDICGVPGIHLLIPTDTARALWMHLLTRFGSNVEIGRRALRAAGWAAFNATRIEAGRPLFGIDFDENSLPAETGQIDRAVSFTKGCYPGQEIVARMHARKQVARQVVGFRMHDDALPMAGTQIFDNTGAVIGGVTSSTLSPVLSNAAIGLAIVKRPFFAPDTELVIPAEGEMRKARVATLPFLSNP